MVYIPSQDTITAGMTLDVWADVVVGCTKQFSTEPRQWLPTQLEFFSLPHNYLILTTHKVT